MTYPEQLKRMTNEELLEKFAQYHSHASWDSYRLRVSKAELLRRMEQSSQEHLKEALEEILKTPIPPNNHKVLQFASEIGLIATKALNQK